MRVLAPGEAVRRLNGDKRKKVEVLLPDDQWKMVNHRMAELGFSTLQVYIETLLEMDTYGKAFEAVVERQLEAAGTSKISASRLADETGLTPRLIGVVRSNLEE